MPDPSNMSGKSEDDEWTVVHSKIEEIADFYVVEFPLVLGVTPDGDKYIAAQSQYFQCAKYRDVLTVVEKVGSTKDGMREFIVELVYDNGRARKEIRLENWKRPNR
jgi:hypothetical protein